ncbi:glycosyltransferase family 4 protein [Paenibacillus sp. N3/727]|uniref:glycosyltransferase family 4 protein n=1 Tax=Paenibacillus sp. N3/727 TaxID=2925845 RepID=UPI001F5379CC|nr:glycosyltransferase family 4 protein [Paenibacillus sp. N3/727]UNK18768.1 glycosyltransferase family 4 protein [Paenibacillus sp. N3/727]
MRIAFYNHTSTVSGAEISLLLTAKHLTKAHPILFAPEGELLQRARSQGLEVVAIPSFRARITRNPFLLVIYVFGMLWAGWRLALFMKRSRIDLIHANSIRAGIMAGLFRWYHRLPVVWHLRDMPPKGLIGKLIQKLAVRTTQALIGISESVIQSVDHPSLEGRCHLVHNGVELINFNTIVKQEIRERIRSGFKTPQNAQVLAIIGQIAPWKRQEDAIEAFSRFAIEEPSAVLWIVGEAKFRQENERYLENLKARVRTLKLEDKVVFTGFREDVLEICCAADLLLLCSENEPFGRVIIEAMSQGMPVVGTHGGGVPEIIQNGESGLMYETGNIEKLTHCIRQVLKDKRVWLTLSHNGQERVRDHFSIKQTSQKIELIYQQLLSTPGLKLVEQQHARELV